MPVILWLPAAVAVVVGVAVGTGPQGICPATATRLLTVAVSGAAVAVVCGLTIAAAGAIAHIPPLAGKLDWCDALVQPHHHVPTMVGVACVLALVVGTLRAARWRSHQRAMTRTDNVVWEPVNVVATDEPIAFAVPGRPGHIVVSSGMLDSLEPRERLALIAHEQAHLDHHHYRYVAVAEVATRVVPILHPLRQRVRFCTERWADEAAAHEVGDREVVASAIARAALTRAAAPSGALAFTPHGVAARVRALRRDDDQLWRSAVSTAVLALAAVATIAAGLVQAHHLVAYVAHVC